VKSKYEIRVKRIRVNQGVGVHTRNFVLVEFMLVETIYANEQAVNLLYFKCNLQWPDFDIRKEKRRAQWSKSSSRWYKSISIGV
jgi:hypothetical protein